MQKAIVKVTYPETGKSIEITADTCKVDIEPGLKKASWDGLFHWIPLGYQIVTIHATAIITKENPAYLSQLPVESEPYMEIW